MVTSPAPGRLVKSPDARASVSHRWATSVIATAHTPVTFVGRPDGGSPAPWIDNDHRTCVREVLDHLAAQGARRIALVAGNTADYYTRACVAAYRDWSHEHRRRPRIDFMTPHRAPEDSLPLRPRPS